MTSLMTTRLWFELRREWGVDIPVQWLGSCRDTAELVDRIAAESAGTVGDGERASATAQAPDHDDESFPLTDLQQSYVFGKQAAAEDAIGCHLYREFDVPGLDAERMAEAWRRVVDHHAMLRAEITAQGIQRIRPATAAYRPAVHDLTDAAPDDVTAHLAAVRARMSHHCHPLDGGPLFGVEITRLPGGHGTVHLGLDALLTDGHGLELLLDHWWRWYEDPEHTVPAPRTSVPECLRLLRAEGDTEAHRVSLDYWAEQLADLPDGPDLGALDGALRADVPDPAGGCLPRRSLTGRLDRRTWRAVRDTADAWEVSPTALVLTLFVEAFARLGARGPFSLVLTTNQRARLPREADDLVGPFTSTAVLPVPDTLGERLRDAATAVHARLWDGLGHTGVSGVAALRERRSRRPGAPAPDLPVVFTSLLDAVPADRHPDGLAARTTYATSQTTGVALDHQMWERDGELHYRWDAVESRFPAGALDTLFALFSNTLHALAGGTPEQRPLNELQQAYAVPRAVTGPAPWDGCQVYHSFHVDGLDPDRLETAWLRLVSAYDVLRTVVTEDGTLAVSPEAPARWHIPVVDLSACADPDAFLNALPGHLVGRAFPLGRAPQADLRVTVRDGAPATVHCVIDLTIVDGRSIHFLYRELFRLYADPEATPTPAEPYAAWAEEQRRVARSADRPRRDAHWRERVAALPPGPDTGPRGKDRRRTRLETRPADWPALREAARKAGVHPDDLLLAAFGEALARHCAPPFALPVVRWTDATARYRPGEFTRLSWVTRDTSDLTLTERARAYRRTLDADIAADAVSGLTHLRRRVLKERRTGAFELPVVYTGMLALTDQPLPPEVRSGRWLTCTPDVSADCVCIEEGDELRVHWDVVSDDFPEGLSERLLEDFRELLDAAARPHSARSGGAPDPGERHRILCEFNDTARDFPDPGPVHLLFERQARTRPDAVAVRWAGGKLTYRELNRRANGIARRLLALGCAPETGVGIALRRGPDMVAAVFGVLKAGGFYVPLEPSLPEARAHTVIEEAGLGLLVTGAGRSWTVPAGVTCVNPEDDTAPDADPDADPEPRATSAATAYVIFTSGSTGKPKGVAVTHRPVLNLLDWCRRTHGFGPGDLGLCVTSLGFDLSVFDLLGLLGLGAAVYIADETQQRDPELLLDVLLTEPVTFWNSAPTTLGQLAPLFAGRAGQEGRDRLRLVYLSGDYTPLPLPDEVRGFFPRARMVSLGGATEATVWSNWFPIGEVDSAWRTIPYGRPIDNARYHVLDEAMEPCPIGVEGDLYIGGACLSSGYLGRPDLTAERFVPDPFCDEPGARLYRTGDRASYYPDGNLNFLGRADHQVKIRGFRVEPGEIEFRLREHPGVKDAVVLARPDPAGALRLVAYVVPADAAPDAAELRRHAAESLPEYMVPNVVAFVDGFPATANGKLDRAALPWPVAPGERRRLLPGGGDTDQRPRDVPGDAGTPQGTDASGPSTPAATVDAAGLVERITAIFTEHLGTESVDPDADLWDQGATSFTMVQVSASLQREYDRRIPVSVLLDEPTVAGVARRVAAELGLAAEEPAGPAGRERPGIVDFFSQEERDAFKAAGWSLRRSAPGEQVVPLGRPEIAAEHYGWRASRRDLTGGPLPRPSFDALLGLLAETEVGDRTRRLYPSASATYAVQVYVRVRPGGVEGLAPGLYYHHPVEHALHLVAPDPEAGQGRAAHFVHNRPVYDRAGFELLLFGQRDGITPLYEEDADRYLALEAGCLGQLLMLGQAACGVGLTPVGAMATGPLATHLGLDDGHVFLQSFLGGPAEHPVHAEATGERPFLAAGTPAARSATPELSGGTEIAVTGVAGHYPGADDLDAYWRLLKSGARALGPVPEARRGQIVADRADGPHAFGGFLPDVDGFDSLLFHVSPQEARLLDPQSRLLLRTVWECLESAGHTAASLTGAAGRVGVFLGAMWQDHQHTGADAWRAGEPALVSATASDTASRISHFFGFDGPSAAVDTSCASSLTALHLAVESLRRGECGAAVVASASLLTHPYHLELLADFELLAPADSDGAYDGARPGWHPGEGVGAVLLRPRPAAERDGDQVLAVVEATRSGHMGGAGRFGTPDATALADSVAALLAAAGRTPADVGYVECASAGAVLADAAETQALNTVFAARGGDPVPIGTVKPNIGHLEAASGLSQLTKVLLQMRHRHLAPTVLSPGGSTLVDWESTALRPVTAGMSWAPSRGGTGPVRALVNAMGATGSHAQVLLRSVEPAGARGHADRGTASANAGPAPGSPQPHVIPLSAATAPQLVQAAARLSDHLRAALRSGTAPALADIAHTLQTGRVTFAERLAVVCSDVPELVARLDAFCRGERVPAPDHPVAAAWLAGGTADWSRARPGGPARRIPLPGHPFAPDRHRLTPASPEPAGTADGSEAARDAGPAADPEAAIAYLTGLYAEVSGIPAERLGARVPLEQYGLSSYLVARLNARLEEDLGPGISRTIFFEHRDLAGVASDLAGLPGALWRHRDRGRVARETAAGASGRVDRSAPAARSSRTAPDPAPADDGRRVAVVGIAGRYPDAPDLDAFWHNLLAGRDSIRPFPEERRLPGWPTELMWGSFLDGVDRFDPLFFGITPRDAALMDPQERLFLEVAWEALEDAGYPRSRLRDAHGSRAGVFVGAMYNEYPLFGRPALTGRPDGPATGSALAGIANRVSYFLDLNGPSMTVDTMCSASLTALHLAVQSLRRGECEVAIAGGVNLSLHPNKFVQQRQLAMDSTDHRCRSFGAGGDGFVPGEGVGAVLLKPLERAVADGDRIHAVLCGTAVNHGGRTNGYMVPNPVAQGELIAAAWRDAGVDPGTLGYLEAHGTGTELGDPVEVNGLGRAFADSGPAPGSCALGSVKSNIGHLEGAAGIAGLTKVVLQLRHATLVPSLHAERLNPHITWSDTPFRVQRDAAPWPAPAASEAPRRAGVSSFGAGGSNAHVVVEAYEQQAARAADSPANGAPYRHGELAAEPSAAELVLLSATDEERLRASAARLAAFLRAEDAAGRPVALRDVARTLLIGREALRERLAVVASDPAGLAASLERFRTGTDPAVAGPVHGRAPAPGRYRPEVRPLAGPLDDLARHWVAGGVIRPHGGTDRPLIGLPSYPFARTRCWAPGQDTAPDVPVAASPAQGAGAGVAPAPSRAADTGVHADSGVPANAAADGTVRLYAREWAVADRAETWPVPADGIVLCAHQDGGRDLAEAWARRYGRDRVVLLGESETADEHAAEAAVAAVLDRGAPVVGWLDLCATDPSDDRDAWAPRLAGLRRLLQTRSGQRHDSGLRVLQVVPGLYSPEAPAPEPAGARLAGVVRMLGTEYPWVHATVFDPGPDTGPDDTAARIDAEWRTASTAGEVRRVAGTRQCPGLAALPDPEPAASPAVPLDPGRVHLVTGGTRGLGALAARHLVSRGARRVALLGRRPLPPRHDWNRTDLAPEVAEAVANIRELERLGALVMVHTGELDAADAALAGFLDSVRRQLGPITGVLHCAGLGSRGGPALLRKTTDDIRTVLAPKADGLDALLTLCAADRLDYFVAYSSVASAVPALGAGVADYAAANAYLDAALGRLAEAGRTVFRAVDWPVWRESGAGADRASATARLGIGALSDAEGLAVLDRVLAGPAAGNVLVCPAVPGEAGHPDPAGLLRSNRRTPPAPAGTAPVPSRPFPWLVRIFSDSLGIPDEQLDPTALFGDLGVESVLLAELVGRIESHLGLDLEPSLLLDHPTLDSLSAHIARRWPEQAAERAEAPEAPERGAPDVEPVEAPAARSGAAERPGPAAAGEEGRGDDRIAVIGMGCRLPGAPDTAALWRLLTDGRSAVGEVPSSRWDTSRLYAPVRTPGRSISKWGGFVDDIEGFDPGFFGMTDTEAVCLDPAIRMMMEASAACLRDAGYRDEELTGRRVGVFVGARMSAYRLRLGPRTPESGMGGDQNFIAARLAQQYDLRGPNMVVDSACSSSLVAVQLACRSLLAGESEVALAGGAEVLLDEEPYLEFSSAGALSPRGRCAAFSEEADGFVPGEGCGVLLLKPLSAAIRDGDRVHAVIDAVAVGNDGRSMGLTTPNPAAQADVVGRALEQARIRPDEVGMIEAHGTGTAIGDPIELRALTDVFRAGTERTGFCAIGSVKSTMGHLLSAAGIAGLLKALLALEHGTVPATLHRARPNPRFDFAASPFHLSDGNRAWPGRRVAGVSAFGLGGTNAHAVATAFDEAERGRRPVRRAPLPAPVFRRRRLWLDRPDAPAAGPNGGPGPNGDGRLVSSLLDLEFT
ncbi:amino acid adenylation domain-containing protein [Streptomyces sp. NPDC054844]